MKTLANTVAAIALAFFVGYLLGCAAPPHPAAISSPETVDSAAELPEPTECAHGTGIDFKQVKRCPDGSCIVGATCDVLGGDSSAVLTTDGAWSCSANWRDAAVGGEMCIHLECR